MDPLSLVPQPPSLARQPLKALDSELSRRLTHLDTLIWKPVIYRDQFGSREGRVEDGALSKEKWGKVKEVIASGNVILTLHDYGGLVLYVSIWSYPDSIFEGSPVRLLTVGNTHLVGISSGLNAPTEEEGLWGIVKPFTHSTENKVAVEAFLPDHKIEERSVYDY